MSDRSDPCLAALISDVRMVDAKSASTYALSSIIDSRLSDSQRNTLQAAIPIKNVPVGINSERARSVARSFFSQTGIEWSEETALKLFTSSLSENAVEAYRTCISGQYTNGTRVIAYNARPDAVTVRVRWIAPPNAPTSASTRFEYTGGTPQSSLPRTWRNAQDERFIFRRNPRSDFDFVANIGGSNDEVLVPYIPRIDFNVHEVHLVEPAAHLDPYRVANRGDGRPDRKTGTIQAPPGSEIVSASVEILAQAGDYDPNETGVWLTPSEREVQWRAQMWPRAAQRGGDLQFRIHYTAVSWQFRVLD